MWVWTSATLEKSDSPSGWKKQSTISLPPFAGRLMGRTSLPKASRSCASRPGRSAPSASMRFTMIMRQNLRSPAQSR